MIASAQTGGGGALCGSNSRVFQEERASGESDGVAGTRRDCLWPGVGWAGVAFPARDFRDFHPAESKADIERRRRRTLDEIVLEGLGGWHLVCGYPGPEDWVVASDRTFGKTPLWPDSLRTEVLQPTARRVGIGKRSDLGPFDDKHGLVLN